MITACATNPAPRPHVAARPPAASESSPESATAHTSDSEIRDATGDAEAGGRPGREGRPDPEVPAWFQPVVGADRSAVISRFGDSRDGGRRSHEGVDIEAPHGTMVVAPVTGQVVVSGPRSLGGNVVVVIDDQRCYEFVCSHLDRRAVTRGQRVSAGDVLGTVGTTGNAAGGPPHLHFEVHLPSGPVDPLPLLSRRTPPTGAGQ